MVSWGQVEREAPELVARAVEHLSAHRHQSVATLRRDGSPRISGIESRTAGGQLYLTAMPGGVKSADLRRDPRVALHSGTGDADAWAGDAKVSGTAVEVLDDAERAAVVPEAPTSCDLFRVDVVELVVVRPGEPADHLVVESWHPGRGVVAVRRA